MSILWIIILAFLTKAPLSGNKPFVCAGIYTALIGGWLLASGTSLAGLLLSVAMTFGLAAAWFKLLDRYENTTFVWWIVFLVGIGPVWFSTTLAGILLAVFSRVAGGEAHALFRR